VRQDPDDAGWRGDGGDYFHSAGATGARQDILQEDAPDQRRPRKSTRAPALIRGGFDIVRFRSSPRSGSSSTSSASSSSGLSCCSRRLGDNPADQGGHATCLGEHHEESRPLVWARVDGSVLHRWPRWPGRRGRAGVGRSWGNRGWRGRSRRRRWGIGARLFAFHDSRRWRHHRSGRNAGHGRRDGAGHSHERRLMRLHCQCVRGGLGLHCPRVREQLPWILGAGRQLDSCGIERSQRCSGVVAVLCDPLPGSWPRQGR